MSTRSRVVDDLIRKLAAALRGAQLYSPDHPIVTRSIGALAEALMQIHASAPSIAIGIVGEELVVGDVPVPRAAENMGELMRRLQQAGIERIVIDRVDEVTAALGKLPHIRVGRLQVEERVDAGVGDMATMRRLYDDAVSIAGKLWESARVEGMPDANAARGMVDSLAQ